MTTTHRFEKVADTGWCWNMFVVPLPGGGTLVHSPTWLGEGTFEKIEAHGAPRVLFAPNHFHHMHLARFRERYPEAKVVAAEGALPRLGKQGHGDLVEIGDAASLFGDGIEVLRCEGVKNGEAWLRAGDALIVSDAFFHVKRDVRGMTGFGLRALGIVPGLRIGKTFKWVGIKDRAKYRAWATDSLEKTSATKLLVSHGEAYESAELGRELARLVHDNLS
jgi:hypothetical protein